jgi:hypothetical protein
VAVVPARQLTRFADGTPGFTIRLDRVTTSAVRTVATDPISTATTDGPTSMTPAGAATTTSAGPATTTSPGPTSTPTLPAAPPDVPPSPPTWTGPVDPNPFPRTDAMPQQPPWATDTGVWAPTVARIDGRYVMFFAAKRPSPPDAANAECVGRAVAAVPEGPYVPDPTPFTCGLGGVHGALDPSVFRDRHGRLFLHVAFGGTGTPLWVIPLTPHGDAGGGARPLLRMQRPWETWFLENPSMAWDGEAYVLAYSAGDWKLPTYSTGVARCRTPTGPCTSSARGPWLSTAGGSSGPGGLTFFTDTSGRLMAAFHAYPRGGEALFGARHTYIRRVRLMRGSIALGRPRR